MTNPDLQETIERCLAAGRDDRLADGQLYLDAATLLKAQQAEIKTMRNFVATHDWMPAPPQTEDK